MPIAHLHGDSVVRRSLRAADLGAVCTVLNDDFIIVGCELDAAGALVPVAPTDPTLTADAASGRPAAALVHPENWDGLRAACVQAAHSRIPVGFLAEYQSAGRPRVLDATCLPLFDDDDPSVCQLFVCTARDVAAEYFRLVASVESMPGITGELASGLTRGEFAVAYQPIFEVRTGRMVGAEALVRWNHPTRGHLQAQDFIEPAEKSGLINEIGEWVMWTACQQVAEWNQLNGTRIGLTVNISPTEVKSGQALRSVTAALAASGLDPALLTLDLKASVLLDDRGDLPALLAHVAALGVQIALDDFGLNYKALLAIRELAGQTVKIDSSLIRNIDENPAAHRLLADLVSTHQSLELVFAAEGVQTEGELRAVRALGFDFVQGRHRSGPLATADFGRFLATVDELPLH